MGTEEAVRAADCARLLERLAGASAAHRAAIERHRGIDLFLSAVRRAPPLVLSGHAASLTPY